MSAKDSLQKARDFIRAQGGKVAPLSVTEEELNPEAQDDLSLQAYPLESTLQCYKVNYKYPDDSDCSEFSFFEDGRQRTLHIGVIPVRYGKQDVLIPVHYFIVASVILQREHRELKVWRAAEIRQGILVEKTQIPDQNILLEFEKSGLEIVSTDTEGGDYYKLRNRALQKAKDLRLAIEDNLIAKWRSSDDASDKFLIVDGTLMNFRNEQNVQQCVGVSKSFGSRYFQVSENNRIMQMEEFERSWTFRFHAPEDDIRKGARERISWYLRLRSSHISDPEFGLIRVEVSRAHLGRETELAERFSKSLLSERLPTSYPYPRWDKHLYPIRECESYLSSIMPSIETINASVKGIVQ